MEAIEIVTNDTKLNPYTLSHKLLLTFYSGQESIKINDFKKFFGRFETYFDQNDLDIFFIEVERLARPDGFIAITDIASMIKNDVDMFPK